MLQDFVRDRVVRSCLAVLLGTFVFALMVPRSVRSADESDTSAFVPRVSVTVAFGLGLGSVAALVGFLSHQSRLLRVETMMRDVHSEATATYRRLGRALDDGADGPLPAVPPGARPLAARTSGFLVQTAEERLIAAARDAGAVLRVDRRPGDTVIEGTPLAWAWADRPEGQPDLDALSEALARDLVVAHERAEATDPSYGLRKLVDIGARALSPGINDPTTAVHALSHLSALLGQAAARNTWHRRVVDGDGRERLLVRSWTFPELLDLAVTQIRDYGRRDATVVDRLFDLLAEVGWRTRTELQREAVRHQCRLLTEQASSETQTGRTAEDVHRQSAAVEDALAGCWRASDDTGHRR